MEAAEYEAMHDLEDRMWWYQGLRTLICDLCAGAGPAKRPVLDAGCGTGGMLHRLAERFPGWERVGVEYDATAARLARTKSGAVVVAGSIESIPLRAASLSAVVCLDVLSHAAVDPPRALKELHRCLETDGIAVLNVPAYAWMLSTHDRRVHNVRRFVRHEVRSLLQQAGFRVVRISHWNTILFPLMLLHRLLTRPGASSDVRPYPRLLNSTFATIVRLETRLIAAGLDFPFGGSIVAVAVKDRDMRV